jgi:hypothetical protein
MRRAAQANWSRLPNHNPPRFYTAWTRNGHAGPAYKRRHPVSLDHLVGARQQQRDLGAERLHRLEIDHSRNLVVCMTDSSACFAPFKIRAT